MVGTLEVGGAERHIAQIFPRLHKSGDYEIAVCALSRLGPLKKDLESGGIRVFGKPHIIQKAVFSSSCIFRIRTRCATFLRLFQEIILFFTAVYKFRPSIVHFYLPQAYITAGVSSLIVPGIRRVMSRRSLNDYQKDVKYARSIESFLHSKMNLITGNSKAVVEQLKGEGVPLEKLRLIYNGVNIPPIDVLGADSGTALEIVCVANLIPYKGHLDLLEALSGLPENLDWHLTCVGRGLDHLTTLNNEVSARGLNERITFAGATMNPNDYLIKASVGVNCSHQEGFSNAVLEYMAFGLAIVVTDVGGNAEAIRNEIDGLVVESGSPVELRKAILRLFDSGLRQQFGGSARARATASFNLDECVSEYKRMYAELT